jgi:hypothetical protein
VAIVTRLERKARNWEQVWQADSEAIASIVAGRLESEGIRTRIQGNTTPYRASALNLGGVWGILVPSGKAAVARDVLRENDEAHNIIESEDAEGLTSGQRATLRFALGIAVIFALIGMVIAVMGQA